MLTGGRGRLTQAAAGGGNDDGDDDDDDDVDIAGDAKT